MRFYDFDWTGGNWSRCQRRGVLILEIEKLFSDSERVFVSPVCFGVEQRFVALGLSVARRWVLVSCKLRKRGDRLLIRPIHARPMGGKEVKFYEAFSTAEQR